MFGILNINKPQGLTSRDVVNRIQRLVRPAKCGHAGTLDPLATGVLIVAVGPATRLIQFVQAQPKGYRGEFRLGCRSNTEDIEGEVESLENPPRPDEPAMREALAGFRGQTMQRPPAFSALKVAGKRAHELARRGQEVALAARPIMVHSLEMPAYEYPEFTLEIRCGGGTYVRSLGRDIARAVNSEAIMTSLVRTSIGSFALEQALSLDDLDADSIRDHLLSPALAVEHLPRLVLEEAELRTLSFGQRLAGRPFPSEASVLAGFDQGGRLQVLLEPRKGELQPVCSFTHYYSS